MARSCVFIAFLVVTTVAVTAQPVPKFDLFSGYSFGHITSNDFGRRHANLNGWDVSLTYNWNKWFGIMAEGSGLYGSRPLSSATTVVFVCSPPNPNCPQPITLGATDLSQKLHTYSVGPRFTFRNDTRYTPFARVLFGGGYLSDTIHSDGLSRGSTLANGSSIWTAGAGLDIVLNSRMAFRTQVDFQRNRFFHQPGPDFRLASGLVFHFGTKK